jgi:hypothetical protein
LNFDLAGKGYYSLESASSGKNIELAIEISNFNSLSEGLYYFDIRVATDDRSWNYNYKICSHENHGFFWNTD